MLAFTAETELSGLHGVQVVSSKLTVADSCTSVVMTSTLVFSRTATYLRLDESTRSWTV